MAYTLRLKGSSKYHKSPSSVYVSDDAKKEYSTPKNFVIKEAGFSSHFYDAKNVREALIKHNKKYGFYGGAVSVSVEK